MDSSFPENELFIAVSIGVLIMLLLAMAFILFFYFSQKKFQQEQLKIQGLKLAHQEQLLFSGIRMQENERRRIARELHDEIGSKLNVINLGVHRLLKSKEVQTMNDETASELFEVIGKTINATRSISHDLLPPTLERFGIQVALEELCENYRRTSNIRVKFELCQNDAHLTDHDVALNLFRILQELLSNSFKYAEADQIDIKLWLGQKEIRITYQDDGKGFDMEEKTNQMGLGINNMESRARMIEAEFSLESEEGKGIFFQLKKLLE